MKSTTSSATASKSTKSAAPATTDAVSILKEDHQLVQKLFKEFEKIQESGSPEEKLDIVLQVCAELKIHTELEEKIFYPAIRESIDEELMMNEAEVEHQSAKDLILQLETMKSDDPKFDAVFTVLSEYIVHHVEEEEKEMFPKAKKLKLDFAELGERMLEMREEMTASPASAKPKKPTTSRSSKSSSASH